MAAELGELNDIHHEETEKHRLQTNKIEKLISQNAALKETVAKLERASQNPESKVYLDVKNMVQVRGQQANKSEVKSMDGRDNTMQQSRSTGNLKSHCAASLNNRHNILSNSMPRKDSLAELKQLLKEIGNQELSSRISSLVQDIYMDAEYRERANLQLK